MRSVKLADDMKVFVAYFFLALLTSAYDVAGFSLVVAQNRMVLSDSSNTENCRIPRAEPSTRGATSYSARTNRVAAEASQHVGLVNGFFKSRDGQRCRDQLVASNLEKFGKKSPLYQIKGFVSDICFHKIQERAPIDYEIDAIFCEAEASKPNKLILGNGDKCGFFAAFYKHKNSGSRLLAVKGSTSLRDWQNNIANRGAKYMEDAAQNFFHSSGSVASVEVADLGTDNNPSNYFKSFVSTLESTDKLLVAGHSLGGALAHNVAAGIKVKWPLSRDIHLVTFNSLSAQAQGNSLGKRMFRKSDAFLGEVYALLSGVSRLPKDRTVAMKIPDGITGVNIATYDDVLQQVNHSVLKSPLHLMPFELHVLLSNRTSSVGSARLKSVAGHGISNVMRDLCWTQHESFHKTFAEQWGDFDAESAKHLSRSTAYLDGSMIGFSQEGESMGVSPGTLFQGQKEERIRQMPAIAARLLENYGPTGRSTLGVGYRCQDRVWNCSAIRD